MTAGFGAECVGDPRMPPIHRRIFSGAADKDGPVHLTENPGFGLPIDREAVSALGA